MVLILSMFGGLGLDVPGEGRAAAGSGAVDQRLREHRGSVRALAEVVVGCVEGDWSMHG
jgi:hypothetical protein